MAYYFASDVHLGLSYQGADPREREQRFVAWLDSIEADCEGLFLVGDIFDFWFEYKQVIPKGFVRTLGKLAEFCDRGIPVHFFVGNHDLWIGDYFTREIGMVIHTEPETFTINGRNLLIAHGDGLGISASTTPGYFLLRGLFHNKLLRRVVSAILHPNVMMRFGNAWSHSRRGENEIIPHTFRAEQEPIVRFAREYIVEHPETDYFVCGHTHTPVIYPISEQNSVVILGEWIEHPIFGKLDSDGELTLIKF